MTNKFIFSIFICLLTLSKVFAQAPNMINYQGGALNAGGVAIANQTINIRASIHNLTPTGTILYSEERYLTTENGGLFNFQIGSPGASATSGIWSAINWETGAKHLQIEMDASGGTNFVNMGTQQLVSVPYAQYSSLSGALVPTATINPNQITSSGASTDQVLKFNGSNWVPGADVSAFDLPYTEYDASFNSFTIYNQHPNGTAIHGSSNGNGLLSTGVSGFASGSDGLGVRGSTTGSNGVGVKGYTNNPSAISIKGHHEGGGVAIMGTSNTTSSSVASILGECTGTSGIGVKGISAGATGIGVYGESASGTGVKGYGNDAGSVAVFGSALAGTGVKAYSFTGKALDVNGNVKIAGGNTNPSSGAVLTSDASGNATWKNNKVSFCVRGTANVSMVNNVDAKVEFVSENHDLQNNFQPNTGTVTPNSSKFTAPVGGVYNFSSTINLSLVSLVDNFEHGRMMLMVNGNPFVINYGSIESSLTISEMSIQLNTTVHLNANDQVWINVKQVNSGATTLTNSVYSTVGYFSGYLLFAD